MEKLLKILDKNKLVSIIVHNNPDPDALASSLALDRLLKLKGHKRVRIFYDGIVGRAENKALIRNLKIPLSKTKNMVTRKDRQLILVDCQPYTGNVTLPEGITPVAVIDHHPLSRKTATIPYKDVRPDYGASSTIIYEYYISLNIPVPKDVATALFYAIFSETQNLGREGSPADKNAYLSLLPQVSFAQLSKIQFPAISKEFISHLSEALLNTFFYKNLSGVILDQLPYPDFVAEMADFLLRIRNITWSICIGSYENLIYISLRTSNIDANASRIIKKVIPRYGTAGGHDMIAGARIKVDPRKKIDIARIKRNIVKKMLKELNHIPVNNLFRLVDNEEFRF
ncbi:MAG: DHH family phosphoesterase [Candidatus Aminicenantes bacterium]|nr:DHH family phosphoesterase [Candidatus Aminicenantes bacterium]